MSTLLPAPPSFGLPDQFAQWRPGQPEAILYALETGRRFCGFVQPTGSGKSLTGIATAVLSGKRTVVLTSTVALGQQYDDDFGEMDGVGLMKGQSRYACKALMPGGPLYDDYGSLSDLTMVHEGPCHAGVPCSLKSGGCTYFDAVRATVSAGILLTSYAWWFSLVKSEQVRLAPDLLICDEAHAAPDALAGALGAVITPEDMALGNLTPPLIAGARTAEQWHDWAATHAHELTRHLESLTTSGTYGHTNRRTLGRIRRTKHVLRQLEAIVRMPLGSMVLTPDRESVRFDVAWAAEFAEPWLFRGVPQVILASATLNAHTADLLGIAADDLTLYEAGDGFAVDRRPVYLIPTVRVDHRWSESDERYWLQRIDQIVGARPDRKGIIHTVSYKRRDAILDGSAYRDRMMTHGSHNTQAQIAAFKRAPAGTVLVSPSVTTGYDFAGDTCRYQIITKVPWPDPRDPITAARITRDKLYSAYVALQEIVQMVGRPVRAADDWAETFIIDSHAEHLFKKKRLAPRWFWRAVRRVETLPPPLSL